VPLELLETVRAFPDGDALLRSGIDAAIGDENACKLFDVFEGSTKRIQHIQVLEGNLFSETVRRLTIAEKVERLVLIASVIEPWPGAPSFGSLIEVLRTRKPSTLIVTKEPVNEEARSAIGAMATLPHVQVLLNESIIASVVACLAPSPWSFGAIGFPSTPAPGQEQINMIVGNGYDKLVRRLANVGLQELATDMNTRPYAVKSA
jgi:hypothetical protein